MFKTLALFQNPGILYYYFINKVFSYFILFYCCGSKINIDNMASRATNEARTAGVGSGL